MIDRYLSSELDETLLTELSFGILAEGIPVADTTQDKQVSSTVGRVIVRGTVFHQSAKQTTQSFGGIYAGAVLYIANLIFDMDVAPSLSIINNVTTNLNIDSTYAPTMTISNALSISLNIQQGVTI